MKIIINHNFADKIKKLHKPNYMLRVQCNIKSDLLPATTRLYSKCKVDISDYFAVLKQTNNCN